MIKASANETAQERLFQDCCKGREDVYDFLQRAVGKKAIAKFTDFYDRYHNAHDGLSGSFDNGKAFVAYKASIDRLYLIGEWLAAAIDEQHFWTYDDLSNDTFKLDENGIPKKLQGNIEKALKDARKWLHRENSLGNPLNNYRRVLYKSVFQKDLVRPEPPPDPAVFFGDDADISFKYDESTDEMIKEHLGISAEEFARQHLAGLTGKFLTKVSASYPKEEISQETLPYPKIYLSVTGSFNSSTNYDLNDQCAYTGGTNTATPKIQGLGIYKRFFANYLETCIDMGLKRIGIGAADIGQYAWLRYGYLPSDDSWQSLRHDLGFGLEKYKEQISETTYRIIDTALQSDNPKAAWLIADQREPIGKKGLPIGFHLINERKGFWLGGLDLTDPDCVDRARAYASHESAPRTLLAAEITETNKPMPV